MIVTFAIQYNIVIIFHFTHSLYIVYIVFGIYGMMQLVRATTTFTYYFELVPKSEKDNVFKFT